MTEVNVSTSDSILQSKFGGDVNKLEQSYAALERQFTKIAQGQSDTGEEPQTEEPSTQTPTEETNTTEVAETPEATDSAYGTAITEALKGVELNPTELAKQYETDGDISQDAKDKLYSLFGKQVVDTYFTNLSAVAQENDSIATQVVTEAVGSIDNWNTITSWASGPNADQQLVKSFNDAIDSKNPNFIKMAAQSLKTAYESANGTLAATSVKSGAAPATSSDNTAFSSQYEMKQAMQNPEYHLNPVYRQNVINRIAATKFG